MPVSALGLILGLVVQDPAPVVVRRAGGEGGSIGVGEVGWLSPDEAASVGQIVLTEPPGYRTPAHVHHRTDETFYVLSGELTLHVGGRVEVLGAGDYAFIPRGTPHAQGNAGTAATTVLLTVSPGDFTAFFRARQDLVRGTPPDHPDYGVRMRALGRDHDIEIVGPPPF